LFEVLSKWKTYLFWATASEYRLIKIINAWICRKIVSFLVYLTLLQLHVLCDVRRDKETITSDDYLNVWNEAVAAYFRRFPVFVGKDREFPIKLCQNNQDTGGNSNRVPPKCEEKEPAKYEGRLKSSWTHFITPSRNFVEVTVSFSKYLHCQAMHSYNAPPTSRKRAADRLPQASGGQ
jgi:hypothetical protein